jgi:hypothetical protein
MRKEIESQRENMMMHEMNSLGNSSRGIITGQQIVTPPTHTSDVTLGDRHYYSESDFN